MMGIQLPWWNLVLIIRKFPKCIYFLLCIMNHYRKNSKLLSKDVWLLSFTFLHPKDSKTYFVSHKLLLMPCEGEKKVKLRVCRNTQMKRQSWAFIEIFERPWYHLADELGKVSKQGKPHRCLNKGRCHLKDVQFSRRENKKRGRERASICLFPTEPLWD